MKPLVQCGTDSQMCWHTAGSLPLSERYRQEEEKLGVALVCAVLPLSLVLAHAGKVLQRWRQEGHESPVTHTHKEKRTSLIVTEGCF